MRRYYEIEKGAYGLPTCFPEGYDKSNLIEVSKIGDSWATFVNIQTGEEISCAEFYAQMRQQQAK